MNNNHWTPEHEAAYMEERKYRCDHCHPEHEDTTRWLESVANQELIYTVYSRYGINPDTIYKEFEAEIALRQQDIIIPEAIEHVA